MKTLAIIMAMVLVLGVAGTVWLRQRQKEQAVREQTSALQSQVQSLESELAQKQIAAPPAASEPLALLSPRTNAVAAAAPTAPSADGKSPPNPAMLNDPETRAMMRKQQDIALARMADKLVSKDFARDWNLSPDQAAQTKSLLQEKLAAGKDLLNAMLFDGLDDGALAGRGREVQRRIGSADEQLRGLLGADGFAALAERERAQEDAGHLKHIREEFANSDAPLTKAQSDSLLAAMAAERQAFTFRVDFNDPSKIDPEHIRDHFSEANLTAYFEDMQQLNARILQRAELFLSATQIQQLQTAQQSQLEQARLTVKMTTELFNKRRPN